LESEGVLVFSADASANNDIAQKWNSHNARSNESFAQNAAESCIISLSSIKIEAK
jgi:hypothetical protein